MNLHRVIQSSFTAASQSGNNRTDSHEPNDFNAIIDRRGEPACPPTMNTLIALITQQADTRVRPYALGYHCSQCRAYRTMTEGSEYDRLFYPYLFAGGTANIEDVLSQVRHSTLE